MADRQAIAQQLVIQRAMSVATLPADDDEPDAGSRKWLLGVTKVLYDAIRERDQAARLDLLMLAGGHLIGWIEAVQEAVEKSRSSAE